MHTFIAIVFFCSCLSTQGLKVLCFGGKICVSNSRNSDSNFINWTTYTESLDLHSKKWEKLKHLDLETSVIASVFRRIRWSLFWLMFLATLRRKENGEKVKRLLKRGAQLILQDLFLLVLSAVCTKKLFQFFCRANLNCKLFKIIWYLTWDKNT